MFLIRLIQKKPYPFASEGCGANRAATPSRRQMQTFVRTSVLRLMHTLLPTQMPRHPRVCRQQLCGIHAKFDMNKPAILPTP